MSKKQKSKARLNQRQVHFTQAKKVLTSQARALESAVRTFIESGIRA